MMALCTGAAFASLIIAPLISPLFPVQAGIAALSGIGWAILSLAYRPHRTRPMDTAA